MRTLLPQSPKPSKPKHDFGMQALLPPSARPPKPKHNFGMQALLPPSARPPKPKHNFGMRKLIFQPPELRCEFGTQGTPPPSPVPRNKSDFRMQEPISPEPQEDLGMQVPSLLEPQVVSSSFKAHGELHTTHITGPCMHLTLVHAGWKWGEQLPLPKESKQEGQPSTSESVCQAIHMLV